MRNPATDRRFVPDEFQFDGTVISSPRPHPRSRWSKTEYDIKWCRECRTWRQHELIYSKDGKLEVTECKVCETQVWAED